MSAPTLPIYSAADVRSDPLACLPAYNRKKNTNKWKKKSPGHKSSGHDCTVAPRPHRGGLHGAVSVKEDSLGMPKQDHSVAEEETLRMPVAEMEAMKLQSESPKTMDHEPLLETVATTGEDEAVPSSNTSDITAEQVEKWTANILLDGRARLAMLSISRNDPRMALFSRPTLPEATSDVFYFGVSPATANELLPEHSRCGRPYLFAGTSLARLALIHKYNLHTGGCQGTPTCTHFPPFEISQAYLYFWDRLEKSAHFLDRVAASSSTEALPWSDPLPNGGSWPFIQRLMDKYGLVPADAYPGSGAFAAAPHTVSQLLATLLREQAVRLLGTASDQVAAIKEEGLAAIFRALVILMGGPPPSWRELCTWRLINTAEQAITVRCTPRAFAQDLASHHFPHANADLLSRLVCIVHDPRNAEGAQLIVGQEGTEMAVDSHSLFRPHSLLNTSMADFKMACECMLKAGYPVVIGCDAARANSHADVGLMDVHAAHFDLAFGEDGEPWPRMSKADRLRTGDSNIMYALVVTGVDIEFSPPSRPADTQQQRVQSRRWRVQSTLRTSAIDHDSVPTDSIVMTDAWMDEFVYLAVVDPCVLPGQAVGPNIRPAASPVASVGPTGRSSSLRPYRGLSSGAATLVRTTTEGGKDQEVFPEATETVVLAASDPMAGCML